jgi:hypothetical protein
MFAAAFRDHAVDFTLGYKHTLSDADRPQLLRFDEPARRECGN